MKVTIAMAYSRSKYIENIKNMFGGALKEYAKYKYAKLSGYKDHNWEPEVKRLCKTIENFISEAETKTNFNRTIAFAEALRDSKYHQNKITEGKNELLSKLDIKDSKKLAKMGWDSAELLGEMIEKYMPRVIRIKTPKD